MLRAQVFKGHWYGWHVVYTIRDHEGNVRYVGCTSQALEVRLRQHIAHKSNRGDWLRAEIAAGRDVTIKAEKRWRNCGPALRYETKLINDYRKLLGDKLVNQTSGRKPIVTCVIEETTEARTA